MNAPANIPIIPDYSKGWAARPCSECEGDGYVWDGKGKGGNDPDSGYPECEECEGEGSFPCDICGCEVEVTGFDCVVCDTLYNLTDLSAKQLTKLRPIFDEALGTLAVCKTAQVAA